MVFDLTISKIEDSLLDMDWSKAAVNYVTHDLENDDGIVCDDELLYVADSLETLARDLRKIVKDAKKERTIYEYLARNNLDFAEFEKMAHLLLD